MLSLIKNDFVLVQCPAPIITNIVPFEKDFYDFGEVIDLRCEVPYRITGNRQVVCQADGTIQINSTCELGKSSQ